MEQNRSWEAKSSSASQEIPRILWNPEVHSIFSKQFAIFPCREPEQSSPSRNVTS